MAAEHGIVSTSVEDLNLQSPEICVICLDRLTEKSIALPCKHDQFDFSCLGTWLHQQPVCPLCKTEVKAVKYDILDHGGGSIFHLPTTELPQKPSQEIEDRRRRHHQSNSRGYRLGGSDSRSPSLNQSAVDFRKHVYGKNLYSLRVGTNRISRYRNFTPAEFSRDSRLISKARAWIRRELSVFEFLNPDSSSFGNTERRASNAEYLLEYIIAIVGAIDIRGSSGQAQEMVKDFLGKENASLFLHELESWLRSPFLKLEDWDRSVQYSDGSRPQITSLVESNETKESSTSTRRFETDVDDA